MDIIQVFRKYMENYHPLLAGEDWKVDVRKVSVENIKDKNLQSILLPEIENYINCWCFYYESGYTDVVFLLQDIRGESNIAITLLRNGIPVYPVSFKPVEYSSSIKNI